MSVAALSGKDLINTGVFTAVYFVVAFAFGIVGFAGPPAALLGYLLGIVCNAVVIALYLARVPRLGALALLMFLIAILMTLTGHPWYMLLLSPLLGLLADLLARSGRYRSKHRGALAYALMTLWYIGPMLPIVFDTSGYQSYIASTMGNEYAQAYCALFSPANLAFIAAGFFLIAYLTGLFGQRLIQKHFRRAGVA